MDSITCWLADVNLAKQQQLAAQERAAVAAKSFFQPRERQAAISNFQDPLSSSSSERPSSQDGKLEEQDGELEESSYTTVTYSFSDDSLASL